MSNVDPKTKVTAAQTRKNIAAYHALSTMPDYKANNPAHSREAADTAYQKRLAAERKAVIERAASSAGCCPSADQVTVLGLKNVE